MPSSAIFGLCRSRGRDFGNGGHREAGQGCGAEVSQAYDRVRWDAGWSASRCAIEARVARWRRSSCTGETDQMNNSAYVGLDVHKSTIAIAIAEAGASGEVRFFGEIANSRDAVG